MAEKKHIGVRCILAACFLLCLHAFPSGAQIKLIPKERIDSLSNPVLSEGAASLDFVRDSIDAGTMEEGDSIRTCCYVFRNVGEKPVTISRLSTTCSCLKARCEYSVVRPMETGRIFAAYSPEGHFGRFEQKIFVYTEASEEQPVAVLKFTVAVGLPPEDGTVFPPATERKYPIKRM